MGGCRSGRYGDRVFCQFELTRDKTGLERARLLKVLLDKVVQALEAEDLSDAVAVEKPKTVKNPFV